MMSMTVPIKTAKQNLEGLLEQLPQGETLTLINTEGTPVAIVVSLKPAPEADTESISDWEAEWEALAEEVGRAWQGDKSALEILSEMRR
jgi:antitoxin (DNA-binding transcriptional repressor) of toxin-antitoxin stability system